MLGWTKIYDNNDVRCYRRPNDISDVDTLKADGIIDRPPEAVAQFCFDNWCELNREIDSDFIES